MSIVPVRLALGASALALALVLSPPALAGGKPAKPPAKPPAGAPAKPGSSAAEIAKTFDEMEKTARVEVIRKRIEALEAYAKANPDAKDVAEAKAGVAQARASLVTVAREGGDHASAVKFADEYLAAHGEDDGKLGVMVSKAQSLEELEDYPGAIAAWEAVKPLVQGQNLEFVEASIKRNGQIGKDPTPFPDDAKDMKGEALSLAALKGKVVLIDFWATWCGPCREEMPSVVAAYDKFHDRGLEIVGISLDREGAEEDIKSFEQDKGMKWPQFYDGQFWKNEIAVLYEVHGIPHTVLLDREGKIAAFGLRGDKLLAKIEKLLGPAK